MSTSIVREIDLYITDAFHCCGDEDLHPFRCSSCGWIMVFCYECDTLYSDLHDLTKTGEDVNHFDPEHPIFSCPRCGYEFEYHFMDNRAYDVPWDAWIEAGLQQLVPSEPDWPVERILPLNAD